MVNVEMPLPNISNVCAQSLNESAAKPCRAFAEMKAGQCGKIAELKKALVAGGFDSVSKQATILGLSRSTAWKVLKSDHKHSGLTASTINRMLTSPGLPSDVRAIIAEYVREKLHGAYGHGKKSLEAFRRRLRYSDGRALTSIQSIERRARSNMHR